MGGLQTLLHHTLTSYREDSCSRGWEFKPSEIVRLKAYFSEQWLKNTQMDESDKREVCITYSELPKGLNGALEKGPYLTIYSN